VYLELTVSGALLFVVGDCLAGFGFGALLVVRVVSVMVVLTAGADWAGALACVFELPPPPQPATATSSAAVPTNAVRLTPRLNTYTGAE
jgi:hypothetical protein